jgi:riboflavin synthase
MFTGIIETIGTIERVDEESNNAKLFLNFDPKFFKDLVLGESIAINGICLTLESFDYDVLQFHLSSETISKVAPFKKNQKVNLERSLKLGDRLSGHFVFGHVDGIAKIKNITKQNDCEIWEIETSNDLMKFFAHKGSVSLNGVSLTINSKNDSSFTIHLIPHTIKHTALQFNKINDDINIEIDMLARYVETALSKQ